MKIAAVLFVASALLAGAAAAQVPAPVSKPEPSEPAARSGVPLNLRLDEAARSAPRITFGRQDAAGKQEPVDNLPTLGGPARFLDAPSRSGSESGSSTFPKDMNPGH